MRNRLALIREVKRAAGGGWSTLLPQCGVTVPERGRHGACPACGGKDRFHFIDDHGGGEWHCRQCDEPNHGDGLDLVARVNSVTVGTAAEMVAGVLGINTRMQENGSDSPGQNQTQRKADNQRREQEHQQQEIIRQEKKRQRFNRRYTALCKDAVPGQPDYLTARGLHGFTFPILNNGVLVLPLVDESGTITGAQTITATGEKRHVTDSTKKGAFYCVAGAPEQPQCVIIVEGLATALTLNLICPDALVVSAVDAGNLLPVVGIMRRKFPQAEIIIAADNDHHQPGECDQNGKLKKNTGLLAAEQAAIAVSGRVALPPTDYKADWDDYRQQNGLEAATQAFCSALYQPEGKRVSVQPETSGRVKQAREERDPLKPRIENRQDGVFWVTPKVDKESGEIINNESWLCSPLEVIGIGRDDRDQYLILRWCSASETMPTTAAIPLADIGEREGWRTLKAGGVNVTTKTGLRATLADWLQRSGSREIWRVAQATGWQCGAYIMPDGEIIGTPATPVLFNGRSSAAAGYTVQGTAEGWQQSVARLAAGNYSMITGVAAALAAPLIGLSGSDGFGIHFYEQSSAGKTTTANVAASLYGNPDLLRLTWYGTALGLANEAAAHNDALMPLDEVGQGVDPHSVAQSAYALFNGVGKLQGAKDGGNRDLKRWRTIAISTGEMDMETFIASTGKKAKAGQLVRLLNIPLSKAVQFHEYQNGKQHADVLKDAWQNNYGAAGREWVKYLADHQTQATEAVRAAESRWRSLIPPDYGEQVHRVAARFAVLEAALLLGRVITGWDEQMCRDAIQHSYNAWVAVFGTGNKEHQQIIEQCEAFLTTHGFSRYLPYPNSDERDLPIKELAGYRTGSMRNDTDIFRFYTFPAVFDGEIAQGFNPTQFAKALAQAGMLETGGDRLKKKALRKMGGKQHTFYVLMYSPEEESDQPE